jgi:uncharacterized LabA/DUF88 family protein
MSKVVFMIDGWFMRKRVYQLKTFFYNGPNIRNYCTYFLSDSDALYRIFYYDTEPLIEKGHNPITNEFIDFGKTHVAMQQKELFASLRRTPNFALRLGKTIWRNNSWILRPEKFKDLISKRITIESLSEFDVHPQIEQKAVDMKIGLDIALIAMKRLADLLIIITGDADIVPALKLARREGMQVGLDPLGCPIQPELQEHADFVTTKINNYRPLLPMNQ